MDETWKRQYNEMADDLDRAVREREQRDEIIRGLRSRVAELEGDERWARARIAELEALIGVVQAARADGSLRAPESVRAALRAVGAPTLTRQDADR